MKTYKGRYWSYVLLKGYKTEINNNNQYTCKTRQQEEQYFHRRKRRNIEDTSDVFFLPIIKKSIYTYYKLFILYISEVNWTYSWTFLIWIYVCEGWVSCLLEWNLQLLFYFFLFKNSKKGWKSWVLSLTNFLALYL